MLAATSLALALVVATALLTVVLGVGVKPDLLPTGKKSLGGFQALP